MKPEIKFYVSKPRKAEEKRPSPEEVTLYGSGAGLYSYLNTLAQALAVPSFQLENLKQ